MKRNTLSLVSYLQLTGFDVLQQRSGIYPGKHAPVAPHIFKIQSTFGPQSSNDFFSLPDLAIGIALGGFWRPVGGGVGGGVGIPVNVEKSGHPAFFRFLSLCLSL